METFKITTAMKERAEKNKEGLESMFLDDKRTYALAFCNEFYKDGVRGDFDTWGNPDDELFFMYVADIHWLTVVIDGDIERDTTEKFLREIERLENYILKLEKIVLVNN